MDAVSNSVQTALSAVQSADSKRIALQANLLRKSLDAQQQQAAELLRQLEGKGQVVDIRV
jgi:hypothetical protein